jgi:senataxin
LLKLKTRTLTCAPTNTAVLEVATRLQNLVKKHDTDTYGQWRSQEFVFGWAAENL